MDKSQVPQELFSIKNELEVIKQRIKLLANNGSYDFSQTFLDSIHLLDLSIDVYNTIISKYESITEDSGTNGVSDQILRELLVNVINLLDSNSGSWPRVKLEYLSHGFSIISANKYTLYGVTERSPKPLPSDISKFPKSL